MSDQQDQADQNSQNAPDAPVDNAEQPTPKPTETVDFWKRKAREQESRAKANAEAADKLRAIEEAQKSAEQRAAEERARQAEQLKALETERDRLAVANARGIPASHMALLGTGSLDELKDNAKLLADLIGKAERWDAHQAAVAQMPMVPTRLGTQGALVGASPVRPPTPAPGSAGLVEAQRRFPPPATK